MSAHPVAEVLDMSIGSDPELIAQDKRLSVIKSLHPLADLQALERCGLTPEAASVILRLIAPFDSRWSLIQKLEQLVKLRECDGCTLQDLLRFFDAPEFALRCGALRRFALAFELGFEGHCTVGQFVLSTFKQRIASDIC